MKRGELKGIILRAYFDISKRDDKNLLMKIAEKNKANRKETQDPPAQNLGSTVNAFGYKRNMRNMILSFFCRIHARLTKDTQERNAFRKQLTCMLYNRMSILKYISDKRMNCFLWKDEGADVAYPKYLSMMESLYEHCSIEIVTKE